MADVSLAAAVSWRARFSPRLVSALAGEEKVDRLINRKSLSQRGLDMVLEIGQVGLRVARRIIFAPDGDRLANECDPS